MFKFKPTPVQILANHWKIQSLVNHFLPLSLGVLAFSLVAGISVLNPSNTGWLERGAWGDKWGPYLGWLHYRNSPVRLPVGLNENYGMGLDNWIGNTASIPLIALPLKLFQSNLPIDFQYFGFWLLVCFMLQGHSAWSLGRRLTRSLNVKILITLLFLFSPILIHRLEVHLTLSSHFFILYGLNFATSFDPTTRVKWRFLILAAIFVDPYIFVMMLFLYLSWEIHFLMSSEKSFSLSWASSMATFFGLVVFSAYQIGFFLSKSGASTQFKNELFKMDLAQPFNFSGSSWIFSSLYPEYVGNFEGYGFLGFGIILGLVYLLSIKKNRVMTAEKIKRYWSLFIPVTIMFLFSLSPRVTLFRKEILVLEVPDTIAQIIGVMRASGRFFWCMYYLLFVLVIYMIIHGYSSIANNLKIFIALFLALIQFFDSSYMWLKQSESPNPIVRINSIFSESESRFVAQEFKVVRVILKNSFYDCPWRELGLYTGMNGLMTNCAYGGRFSPRLIIEDRKLSLLQLKEDSIPRNTVYLLSESELQLIKNRLFKNKRLYRLESGLYLLLPAGRHTKEVQRLILGL